MSNINESDEKYYHKTIITVGGRQLCASHDELKYHIKEEYKKICSRYHHEFNGAELDDIVDGFIKTYSLCQVISITQINVAVFDVVKKNFEPSGYLD